MKKLLFLSSLCLLGAVLFAMEPHVKEEREEVRKALKEAGPGDVKEILLTDELKQRKRDLEEVRQKAESADEQEKEIWELVVRGKEEQVKKLEQEFALMKKEKESQKI